MFGFSNKENHPKASPNGPEYQKIKNKILAMIASESGLVTTEQSQQASQLANEQTASRRPLRTQATSKVEDVDPTVESERAFSAIDFTHARVGEKAIIHAPRAGDVALHNTISEIELVPELSTLQDLIETQVLTDTDHTISA